MRDTPQRNFDLLFFHIKDNILSYPSYFSESLKLTNSNLSILISHKMDTDQNVGFQMQELLIKNQQLRDTVDTLTKEGKPEEGKPKIFEKSSSTLEKRLPFPSPQELGELPLRSLLTTSPEEKFKFEVNIKSSHFDLSFSLKKEPPVNDLYWFLIGLSKRFLKEDTIGDNEEPVQPPEDRRSLSRSAHNAPPSPTPSAEAILP